MPNKAKNFLYCILTGIILTAAWYWRLQILIFLGFVPLMLAEDQLSNSPKRKLKVFGLSYLAFFIWNVGVTWWIALVQFGQIGAVVAWVVNALLMAIIFMIYSNIKKRYNKNWGAWLLLPLWLGFEYLHSYWDLAWIWLNLGNVFAYQHTWVQWYEFTGASGGSLWVVAVNITVFLLIKKAASQNLHPKQLIQPALLIVVPIAVSYLILNVRTPLDTRAKKYETVVVQPNIDPYNVKFSDDYESQFLKALRLIRGQLSKKTEYLVLPETFITGIESIYGVNEQNIEMSEEIIWFRDSLVSRYPNLKIVVGASSYFVFRNPKESSSTARHDPSGVAFDCYNTALQIDRHRVQLYHKSKLVPGVEWLPSFIGSLAIDMGGTSGSLGVQKERVSFSGNDSTVGVAPVVCYESVFADYMTEYIRKGASFIFIITNDGWWSDSPGYVDHLNYARLRAIENRRQIARSANTGVSCFMDEFGNIYDATKFWKEAVIKKEIVPNSELTFFSRFGDLLSYFATTVAVLLLLFSFYLKFRKK